MRFAAAALFVLALAAPVAAQEARLDVDKLPLDLEKIRRQLDEPADRVERDGINLRYFVQIYGQAPPIQLFTKEDNLATGPVPYGGPTHQEILDVITPKEFRSPVIDFNSVIRWLSERVQEKKPESR